MIEIEKCCGCAACYNSCPKKCISLKEDSLGFYYPFVDKSLCINCNKCESVCPAYHGNKGKVEQDPVYTWGGHVSDQILRRSSSSGGLFSIFALSFIDEGGVVYGAALDLDCKSVNHTRIDNREELWKLRGSKYVQSKIGNIYSLVKNDLINGTKVLFSGTPCQIDGLRLFLGKRYNNLLTIEIICHGTPSPKIYSHYIDYMQQKLGDKIKRVFFRDEIGGGILIMKIETEKGVNYQEDKFTDPFYRMFLSNTCLRESCYQCPSRGLYERADITLSDFWGVENVAPDLNDGKGVSLVIIHTINGLQAFNKVKAQCEGHEVDFNKAIVGNESFFKSYERPTLRTKIEKDIDTLSFEKIVDKYSITYKERLKKILNKLHLLNPAKAVLHKLKGDIKR